jgi:glycosyltransferase involved in cell wall biosynthesis
MALSGVPTHKPLLTTPRVGFLEDLTPVSEEICLAIVIPALNEEASIGATLDQIYLALNGYQYTILVVDGNSSDDTARIAEEKGATVIPQRNRGYGDALLTGFHYVCEHLDAKVIVMMDADLTYDPENIPELLHPILKNETDMVVGNRFEGLQNGAMPRVNRFGNKLLSWIARQALGVEIRDTQCGIRAFKPEVVRNVALSSAGMSFATEMLARAKFEGFRIEEVPVAYRPRRGESKLNPVTDGAKILGTILRLAWEDSAVRR